MSLHPSNLAGLLEFQRRFREVTPLVLCDAGRETTAQRLGLPVQPWKDFLLEGPNGRIPRAAS